MKLKRTLMSIMLIFSLLMSTCIISYANEIDPNDALMIGTTVEAEETITVFVPIGLLEGQGYQSEVTDAINGNSKTVAPASFVPIDITPTLIYEGGGSWNFMLNAISSDWLVLFKYINGTASMSGDYGSHSSTEISGNNLIPMSAITGNAYFLYMYPNIGSSGTVIVRHSGFISSLNSTAAVWGPSISTFNFEF